MSKEQKMIDYILDIDWLTTKEFCDKYDVKMPEFMHDTNWNVSELFRIDAIKWKMVMEYAKKLKQGKK